MPPADRCLDRSLVGLFVPLRMPEARLEVADRAIPVTRSVTIALLLPREEEA
jgi:hypothetical protein